MTFDENSNNQMFHAHLTLINEIRVQAAKRDVHYKKLVARNHNAKVKPFSIRECDLVLRKNEVSRLDPNKNLDPTWEGPYLVIKSSGNGSYKLQDFEGKISIRAWNNLNLKNIFPKEGISYNLTYI